MRLHIKHITMLEFLPTLKKLGRLRLVRTTFVVGLRVQDLFHTTLLGNVLSNFDVKIRTPTPPPASPVGSTLEL